MLPSRHSSVVLDGAPRLTFSPDKVATIAATIDAERRCCRFLRFDLTVEPDGGPVWLTLTGPKDTREFLMALIES